MSDSELRTPNTQTSGNLPSTIVSISLILAVLFGMSNNILAGAKTIPYDKGGSEDVPAAAARLCNVSCSQVPGGCAYTFGIEVFETCWKAVYALEIVALLDGAVEPASWPDEWRADTGPRGALNTGSVVFYTVGDPILPGTVRTGFGLVSYSGSMALRWSPADEDGILIGKVSRVDLSCPTATEVQSWGSIKAIYR
jgi:hypothetical protein